MQFYKGSFFTHGTAEDEAAVLGGRILFVLIDIELVSVGGGLDRS
jgi:hypothetical protein